MWEGKGNTPGAGLENPSQWAKGGIPSDWSWKSSLKTWHSPPHNGRSFFFLQTFIFVGGSREPFPLWPRTGTVTSYQKYHWLPITKKMTGCTCNNCIHKNIWAVGSGSSGCHGKKQNIKTSPRSRTATGEEFKTAQTGSVDAKSGFWTINHRNRLFMLSRHNLMCLADYLTVNKRKWRSLERSDNNNTAAISHECVTETHRHIEAIIWLWGQGTIYSKMCLWRTWQLWGCLSRHPWTDNEKMGPWPQTDERSPTPLTVYSSCHIIWALLWSFYVSLGLFWILFFHFQVFVVISCLLTELCDFQTRNVNTHIIQCFRGAWSFGRLVPYTLNSCFFI